MRSVNIKVWLSELRKSIRQKAAAIELRAWLGKLYKAAHRNFPKFFPDPDHERRLAVYRSRDAEENERSSPSDGESIQLLCFWAAEYYLPSHLDGLVASFEKLGWDEEDEATATNSPVRWLRHRRQTLSGGGWMNLGRIDRLGRNTTIPRSRIAPLPDDVDFALGYLYSITSTISCVVIAFVLKEEASLRYDQALRRNYETALRPLKRGHTIIGPNQQKLSAIRDIRSALRADLAAWYRSNLPGFFSAENVGAGLPTCEFQTLAKGVPFPPREDGSPRSDGFLTALDIDIDVNAWEYEGIPGLKFAWPLMHDRSQENHAIIAANEGDFSDEAIRHYGGRNGRSLSSYVDDHINVLLGRWALLGVVVKLQQQFSAIRESAHILNRSNKDALRALKRISDLFSKCVDSGTVADELSQFSSDAGYFSHDVADFRPCWPEYYRDKDITISNLLCESVSHQSRMLTGSSESVRTLLAQQNAALGTVENVRLQRKVTWLTLIILVLTLVMAWGALRENPFWHDLVTERAHLEQNGIPAQGILF